MSGYLEAYGAAEQQRANRLHLLKNASIILACVVVVGLILYGTFKNYSQEHKAKTFVALLSAHDYKAAYAMWGCTDSHPCTEYPFDKFMEDWGPKSAACRRGFGAHRAVAILRLGRRDPDGLQRL